MKNAIRLVLIAGLLFIPSLASAKNINIPLDNNDVTDVWNSEYSQRASFTEKHNTHYLTIYNRDGDIAVEHLIPRAKKLANITWATDGKRLSFTENDRNLWVLNIKHNTVKLISSNFSSEMPIKFNAQWSASGIWLQYLSKSSERNLAKVYSTKRNRSFIIPVNANQVASINWQGFNNTLIINKVGSSQIGTELSSIYGIQLIVKSGTQVAQLY